MILTQMNCSDRACAFWYDITQEISPTMNMLNKVERLGEVSYAAITLVRLLDQGVGRS